MTTNLLYDRDYCLWLEEIAKLLRDRKLEYLDFEHLIAEIEDLGTETKLPTQAFPTESPFQPENAIDPDFIVVLVSQEEI